MQRVLVVDDSPAMRGLIASIIDQIGNCEVTEASNGYEALKELPRQQFALIVTDINMPDINGLELISYIRKSPNYADTPVVIVTTEGANTDRDRGMKLGATAYFVKPFNPEDFVAKVSSLLSREP